jgi:DNA-binding CsgD family transcriptional regulator
MHIGYRQCESYTQSSECGLFVDGAGLIALPERSATGRLRQAIAAVPDERLFTRADAAGALRRLLLKRLPKASNGKGYYALVLLDDVGQGRRDTARLARLFGFTAKQGELAGLLLAGLSVPQAAARMGISRSTAGDHMRLLFDKTHTARQAGLVRVLARAASL